MPQRSQLTTVKLPDSMDICWHDGGYYVSVPNYQCGNVFFNCEQRPADNERHLSSWKGVKEFADAALQPKAVT